MFSTNNKIFDQIFELKFLSKQLVKESKRCESEESSQKLKAKQAMVKGNMEGAKIYAQNAIRKKSESINYLQLASRLDAVVARLDQQSKMGQVNKNMVGIVNSLGRALKNAPLDRMVATMNTFEKQFENLDVQTGVMNDAMNQQAALATPPEQVNMLLQQIADENGLEVRLGLPQASSAAVPATAQKEEDGTLASRLASLRGAK